jgi:ABC-type protease/lipase transport system fused ATPase/permease subunit
VRGCVRLDGAALDQWTTDSLGRHIGYLPQNVELLDGTVAENIARFDPEAATDDIIAAAKLAGVHDLVVRLPEGYQTQVGADGSSLSAGQRQRIALARALYKDPFLVVLDEPNSNLDAEGETALAAAVTAAAARGAIVILVAHRQSILSAVQLILYMRDGRALAYGPKEDVLRRIAGGEAPKKLGTAAAVADAQGRQQSG